MRLSNEVIEPSENGNTAAITNALTQHPDSVISLQIIPTQYTVHELYGVEESKRFLNYYVSQIRYRHGLRVDENTQMLVEAYDYYSKANNEPLFLYNLLVYSEYSSATDLANRLVDVIEAEGKARNENDLPGKFSNQGFLFPRFRDTILKNGIKGGICL